ncbi:flavodoxin family protein [Desulfoglaeba alkanexedens ALDC]|jgi:multimeric flavodoxin WrbA|uniref:Flavodoxin family protein n=2 Tax=Desulfoglaeba alkanexedens TaxID=361111 RepID=A0A4P8L3D4_9BACT|nr:flavodoxin family protein [Desulfoglaeba alkanexedens ALDC]
MTMLIGFNGSPKPGSNTRKMVELVLEASGHPYKIYDLAKLNIRPCIGCVKCAKDSRCVLPDDMQPLYEEISKADGIVVGATVYFRKANGFTHNFLERLFPLRHVDPQTMGMPAVALAVGGDEAEVVARDVAYHLKSYFNFEIVDQIFYNTMNPPCFICGYGTTCQYGGPARWMSPEEFAQFTEITPEMFKHVEAEAELTARLRTAGQRLGESCRQPA